MPFTQTTGSTSAPTPNPTSNPTPVPTPSPTLPLRYQTPPVWAQQVMRQPLALLNDHAHLEKKAGANALELLNRWPLDVDAGHSQSDIDDLTVQWVQTTTAIAKDEIDHLGSVLRILFRRGGRFTKSHRNPYAAELRQGVRTGQGPLELLDRLLISALIEARSCERFEVLGEHGLDDELSKLYRELAHCERGHYTVFLTLAQRLPGNLGVDARWNEFLDAEAAIIQKQTPGPRIHSGVA